MTVWIVEWVICEETGVYGVFASEQSAIIAAAHANWKYGHRYVIEERTVEP